jgi:hypothetical protein
MSVYTMHPSNRYYLTCIADLVTEFLKPSEAVAFYYALDDDKGAKKAFFKHIDATRALIREE